MFKWLKATIRGYFFAGLLVIVPLGITIFVISAVLRLMDRILDFLPPKFHPDTHLPFPIPGLGPILGLLLIMLTGILVKNYIGRRVVDFGEYLLSKIPLVRPVYAAAKQLLQAMFGDTHDAFKRVVLVEYPRKGVYALAFVTGVSSGELQEKTSSKMINVFLPTTPNPTSGFYLMVPEQEAIPLSISVEEAFKLLISGGAVELGVNLPQFPFGRRVREARTSGTDVSAQQPSTSSGGEDDKSEKNSVQLKDWASSEP
ncbi:MAG: DUF502 domain-containing protein [Deltaproteobacteria bacterium]|nr:MAG: DUF502 domain-containing protein [Deltaproteobacteria bacterium]